MAIERPQLKDELDAECAVVRALVALLHDEQQALASGQVEHLAARTASKEQLLSRLSAYSQQRDALLQASGHTQAAGSMESLLRKRADAGELARAWQSLLETTRIAQRLNTTNGRLISTRLHGTQQALDALLSAARIPRTYAPDGSTVSLHSARTRAVV